MPLVKANGIDYPAGSWVIPMDQPFSPMAKELMERGRITLPRPDRDELIEIRKGKYSLSEIRELGAQLESEALAAQATSTLPDKVNRDAINHLLAEAHLQFWSTSAT